MTITAKPIPFTAPMIKALLREIQNPGTGKTQTRREFKLLGYPGHSDFGPSDTKGYDWHFRDKEMRFHDFRHDDLMKLSPYQVGELRYVREHWRTLHKFDCLKPSHLADDISKITYEADPENRNPLWAFGRFRHGMHMPRWASRITLEISDVRVQRLQDINEADARAEGPDRGTTVGWSVTLGSPCRMHESWASAFRHLWQSINGPESWDANPWVWAVSFKPHLINVDQMIKERAAA